MTEKMESIKIQLLKEHVKACQRKCSVQVTFPEFVKKPCCWTVSLTIWKMG